MEWYRGRKVFVTGGSSGIGKAVALRLARSGAHVWISARGRERLDAALAEIRAAASPEQKVGAVALDVSDRAAVSAAAPVVLEGLGGLDVLVNNAGIAHPGYLHETPPDVFESMMRTNYFGTVWSTLAFLPHFMGQKSGNVCSVASTLGFMGIFGYGAYAASKFAVTGFSDCLRQDLLPYGVRVHVVFPADVDTPQLTEENRIKPPETKAIAGNIKVVQPEFVAEALLEGVAAGRYHIVPGAMNKATWLAVRWAPWLVRTVIDGDLMKFRNRDPREKKGQA